MGTTDGAAFAGRTVADAMVTRPHVHGPATTLADARDVLLDTHVHLLLLVEGGRLLGTVSREDLARGESQGRTEGAALAVARLGDRTVAPGEPLDAAYAVMRAAGQRRRAVVDADGHLVGLLCLKRSGAGFCTDAGVAARVAERAGS